MYIHTYIHTVCIYTHTYIQYVYTHIHTECIYTHTMYIHISILELNAYIYSYIHTYIYTYIHTCMHTYIHTYIYSFLSYIYIHTYIHNLYTYKQKKCLTFMPTLTHRHTYKHRAGTNPGRHPGHDSLRLRPVQHNAHH